MPSLGGGVNARIYGGPIQEGQRDAAREAFRRYLMQRVPGYDGGDRVPTSPDGTIPGLGRRPSGGAPFVRGPDGKIMELGRRPVDSGRLPSLGNGAPRLPSIGSGSEIVSPGLNTATGTTREALDHIAAGESGRGPGGYNVSLDHGRWLPGGKEHDLTKLTLDQVDSLQTGMLSHPENRAKYGSGLGSSAIGRYQIVRKTLRGLRGNMGLKGGELYDEQMQDRLAMQLFSDTRGRRDRLANEWQSLRGHKLDHAMDLYQRWRTDPGSVSQRIAGIERPAVAGVEEANGAGWAAREKARKEFETQMKAGEARLDRSAGRAGVVGGPTIENNGSVSVVVQRPGPDTHVRTSASGNLFKDVVLQRGRPMAKAEGT